MVDLELIKILCCPETKEDVEIAEESLIASLNEKISTQKLVNRGGDPVTEKVDGGLIRADKKYLYPIREDIPIMLIDEAIPLENMVK